MQGGDPAGIRAVGLLHAHELARVRGITLAIRVLCTEGVPSPNALAVPLVLNLLPAVLCLTFQVEVYLQTNWCPFCKHGDAPECRRVKCAGWSGEAAPAGA